MEEIFVGEVRGSFTDEKHNFLLQENDVKCSNKIFFGKSQTHRRRKTYENKCTLENTPLSSGNFGTYLKDFGLDNCDVIVGIFIPEVTPIANASFFEVEATANNNMELQ
nr:hypothetical protein CFP56_74575 [Quercus suber]